MNQQILRKRFQEALFLGQHLKLSKLGDAVALRSHLLEVSRSIEQVGQELGLQSQTLELAQFAVAAYLDEMIMSNADWPQRSSWPAMSLQYTKFNTTVAGKGFFEHLTRIRNGLVDNSDFLLELYYACLCLGFRGRYTGQEEQRRALIQQIGQQLKIPQRTEPLAPQGLPNLQERLPEPHFPIINRKALVIGTITVVLLYAGFASLLSCNADHVAKKLEDWSTSEQTGQ